VVAALIRTAGFCASSATLSVSLLCARNASVSAVAENFCFLFFNRVCEQLCSFSHDFLSTDHPFLLPNP
jgi:hypothetical protein